MFGWQGKVLRADLSSGRIGSDPLDTGHSLCDGGEDFIFTPAEGRLAKEEKSDG